MRVLDAHAAPPEVLGVWVGLGFVEGGGLALLLRLKRISL